MSERLGSFKLNNIARKTFNKPKKATLATRSNRTLK